METRRSDTILELGELIFHKREVMSLEILQQLPDYLYFYERFLTINQRLPRNMKDRFNLILNDLYTEFEYIWIHMNIPCMSRTGMVKKFSKLLENFKKLMKYTASQHGEEFYKKLQLIRDSLKDGVDILTPDSKRIEELEELYGVDYGEEEVKLYTDNCIRDETKACPRKRWCGGEDAVWKKKAKERRLKLEKQEHLAKKREEMLNQNRLELERLHAKEDSAKISDIEGAEIANEEDAEDSSFIPGKSSSRQSTVISSENQEKHCMRTRSQLKSQETDDTNDICDRGEPFPQIPIRTGYKTFNIDIIESLAVIESVYKVDGRKAPSLLMYIGNKIFKQNWKVGVERKRTFEDVEAESEGDENKKKQRKLSLLDNQMPDRATIAKVVEDLALLSYRDMAEAIVAAKEEEKTVTYGVGDTVKAAGHRRHISH